mmetsp:Transcript_32754/g.76433  ORF Transcript_32754/g.76433 Transcript_32754/m.76433 type:complete len:208 (+) Transcript_32754:115-738(+)
MRVESALGARHCCRSILWDTGHVLSCLFPLPLQKHESSHSKTLKTRCIDTRHNGHSILPSWPRRRSRLSAHASHRHLWPHGTIIWVFGLSRQIAHESFSSCSLTTCSRAICSCSRAICCSLSSCNRRFRSLTSCSTVATVASGSAASASATSASAASSSAAAASALICTSPSTSPSAITSLSSAASARLPSVSAAASPSRALSASSL